MSDEQRMGRDLHRARSTLVKLKEENKRLRSLLTRWVFLNPRPPAMPTEEEQILANAALAATMGETRSCLDIEAPAADR